jgi:hypothetical protein
LRENDTHAFPPSKRVWRHEAIAAFFSLFVYYRSLFKRAWLGLVFEWDIQDLIVSYVE